MKVLASFKYNIFHSTFIMLQWRETCTISQIKKLESVIDVDVSPLRHENNNIVNIAYWATGTVHEPICIAIFSCKMSIPFSTEI